MGGSDMSRVISGWVVSRNSVSGMWRAWDATRERGSIAADTYRGLLAMIREANGGAC